MKCGTKYMANLDTVMNSERVTRGIVGAPRFLQTVLIIQRRKWLSLLGFPPVTPFPPMRLLATLLLNSVHGKLCFKRVFIESRRTRSVYSQKRVILQVANYGSAGPLNHVLESESRAQLRREPMPLSVLRSATMLLTYLRPS